MSFTNPDTSGPVATLNNWFRAPIVGYHQIDTVTFGKYSPVMPSPLPPTGTYHPQPQVSKTTSPVGQNVFSLYTNPNSLYTRSTFGQR